MSNLTNEMPYTRDVFELVSVLRDDEIYFKQTLVNVLRSIRKITGLKIAYSQHTIYRREAAKVPVYINIKRESDNGWRVYTGKQIKKIVAWELERKQAANL